MEHVSLHQATFLRDSHPLDLRREYDGRSPVRRGGPSAMTGSVSELIGFDASLITSSGPGTIRSKFRAIDSHAGQVAKGAINDFLEIRSIKDLESFAQSNGLLGLYPTVQTWRVAGETRRFAGEPVDSWLWQIDRLRTLLLLVKLESDVASPRTLKKRLFQIWNGSVRGCIGKSRYIPLHESNDLRGDDPILDLLRHKGPAGCREFASLVVGDVLRNSLVVMEIRRGEVKLATDCLLGFLYLQFAQQHDLLSAGDQPGFTLCRWCNEQIYRKSRGPSPIYCKKCLHARQNYPEAEAFRRRQEAMKDRELRVRRSTTRELVNKYVELFGEEEGMKRVENALKKGLPNYVP